MEFYGYCRVFFLIYLYPEELRRGIQQDDSLPFGIQIRKAQQDKIAVYQQVSDQFVQHLNGLKEVSLHRITWVEKRRCTN